MDKNDLLKLLDLEGKEALPEATDLAITPTEPVTAAEPASPTALDLDDWALRRGEDLRQDSERLQALDLDDQAVADFHGAACQADELSVQRSLACVLPAIAHLAEKSPATPLLRLVPEPDEGRAGPPEASPSLPSTKSTRRRKS